MNILYSGDKKIEDGLIISILSLLKNTHDTLAVYVLTVDFETAEKAYRPVSDRVIKLLDDEVKKANENSFVKKIDITERFMACFPVANKDTRFTPCCMLRLYADLVPEIPDRLLYLDNDVICRKDIKDFYDQDIEGCEFAGVLDRYGKWFYKKHLFKHDYVNSGVLLLNMKLIRQNGLFVRCREMCRDKKLLLPDQAALNSLANNKKFCKRMYNEQKGLRDDTVLQHFTTQFRYFPKFHTFTVKPWDVERVHSELALFEYDDILAKYQYISKGLSENESERKEI